jgi:hypothetical protein
MPRCATDYADGVKRYIDSIDQSSFLLADDSHSKREKVFIWSQYTPTAVRMDEYKIVVKAMETQAQWLASLIQEFKAQPRPSSKQYPPKKIGLEQ